MNVASPLETTSFDILIVGAGTSGLSFARSLNDTNLSICVVDGAPSSSISAPKEDGRDIALTRLSEQLMSRYGMWEHIPENRVGKIIDAKVTNGDSHYTLNFEGKHGSDGYLGKILPNHLIRFACYETVKNQQNVTILTDTKVKAVRKLPGKYEVMFPSMKPLTTKLLIAADSRFSTIRKSIGISTSIEDFGRSVIVCEMDHELEHSNLAWECFLSNHTLAVLPMPGQTSSIVLTLPNSELETFMEMERDEFAHEIEVRFENRLGKMDLRSARHAYSLVATCAKRFVAKRFALIGDAAIGMHPVTAHGFNLGLSGANTLGTEIAKTAAKGLDFASEQVLMNYETAHRKSCLPVYHATNALVKLYTNERPSAKFLRSLVLRAGNTMPLFSKAVARHLSHTDTAK